MTENVTSVLVKLIHDLREEEYPPDIYAKAKECVLDYLGVTFAGAYTLRDKVRAYLDGLSPAGVGVPVIGFAGRASVHDAAMLNGIAAHCLELDDGSRFGMVHPGAPVLSALFAVAYDTRMSAERFLRAIVVGYEVTIRLSSAIQPGHKKKGFHATGTCGCIGAAAAVSAALAFPDDCIANVMSAAAASAAGLLEMMDDTSELKPFSAGKAAQNAVMAAYLGRSGFSGPRDAIGGKRGLIGVMGAEVKMDWFRRDGERRYAIRGIYHKPYASCRHCHPSVEAALKMLREERFDPGRIETIVVHTYDLAVFGHDHTEIINSSAAKMSIPYSVAAAFMLKSGGMSAMAERAVHDPEILALARKVRVEEDPDYSALVPAQRMARLTATMTDGTQYSREVTYPKGEPENPMDSDELEEKFLQLAAYSDRTEAFGREIIHCVNHLEENIHTLFTLIEK